MSTRRRYTDEEKQEILAFVEAEGRGGVKKASEKFNVSPVTISSWKRGANPSKEPDEISEARFVRVMAGKGFQFTRLVNDLTGEVVKEETDPKIDNLGLEFSPSPKNCEEGVIHVTQTSPQIQVSMSFDTLLNLLKIKP